MKKVYEIVENPQLCDIKVLQVLQAWPLDGKQHIPCSFYLREVATPENPWRSFEEGEKPKEGQEIIVTVKNEFGEKFVLKTKFFKSTYVSYWTHWQPWTPPQDEEDECREAFEEFFKSEFKDEHDALEKGADTLHWSDFKKAKWNDWRAAWQASRKSKEAK